MRGRPLEYFRQDRDWPGEYRPLVAVASPAVWGMIDLIELHRSHLTLRNATGP